MARRTGVQARRSTLCHRHDRRRGARPQNPAGARARLLGSRQGVPARPLSDCREPRLKLVGAMAAHASGGMDVSDGFVGDLTKMLDASASRRRADSHACRCRTPRERRSPLDPELFEVAATGGDDYELLASAPPDSAAVFEAAAAAAGVAVDVRSAKRSRGGGRRSFVGSTAPGRLRARSPIAISEGDSDDSKPRRRSSTCDCSRRQAVAREAGAMARRRFLDRSFTVGFKGPQDYLTEVDGETEAFIAERLAALFPEDGFIGEEGDARPRARAGQSGSSIRSTARRISPAASPHFCVSIACVVGRKVEVGVIYDPMLDELFAARRGGGARLNGAPISVVATSMRSPIAAVEVGWNSRAGFAQYVGLLRAGRPRPEPRRSRTGSGALAIAYVAAGRRDGFVENHINAWDCLAGDPAGRARPAAMSAISSPATASPRAIRSSPARPGSRTRSSPQPAFEGIVAMTEIKLARRRRRKRRSRSSAPRRRQWRIGWARAAVARRSGDLERHQPDPLSGRRLDAQRRGAGRWPPLHARAARLRPVRDLRRRVLEARLRPAGPQRQCAHARGLSVRFRAGGRIPADAPTRSQLRSKSPIPARWPRLTPAGCIRASAGRSARRGAMALWCGSIRRSGPRFRSSRRAGWSSRPSDRFRFKAATCR